MVIPAGIISDTSGFARSIPVEISALGVPEFCALLVVVVKRSAISGSIAFSAFVLDPVPSISNIPLL